MEEVTADAVERAGELELQVEPEDGPEWLPSHDKAEQIKSSFLWMNKVVS